MRTVNNQENRSGASLDRAKIKPVTPSEAIALRDAFIDDGLDHTGEMVIVDAVLVVWDQATQQWSDQGGLHWASTNW